MLFSYSFRSFGGDFHVILIMGTNIHYKIQKFPVVCGSRARAWGGHGRPRISEALFVGQNWRPWETEI